ncbi:mitochondrial arginine transporter BAC1 isoform X2 [Spinacia oleracea]|uniref:Mitochondrial arginine transporter BAC1 isoform X2 n=1 Tax=Spinacia oleracea TaxID=3562 RepID=A0A9R0HRD4_SPIOL|nr:mitochondrial arginine transporter BAC1 isoform X2 [Spinacia oleracea]
MVECNQGISDGPKYKEYLAGLIAGVATVIIGHPFDTVKVKLQKHNTELHGVKYKNGLHCAARILQNEGVRGLYRGAASSFIGMGFESSLLFGIYSQTKQSLQGKLKSSGPDSLIIIPSAVYSGAIISFVLCPTELVKVTGIFRGGTATFLRESLGNAVFFSVYESVRYSMHLQLKDASRDHKGLADLGVGIISGGLGGVAFWSAVLPLDVAKTMIQTNPDPNYSRNPFQVLKLIYKQAGLRGCYAGLGPTIARAFPANAAAIVTWEFAMKILGIRHE